VLGEFDFLTFTNMQQILATKPTIFLELGLVTDEGNNDTEWIAAGKYIVTAWQNDITNKVIIFTANDYFAILGDIPYNVNTLTAPTLMDLAVDVLTVGEFQPKI
jgi:hypothetical protein